MGADLLHRYLMGRGDDVNVHRGLAPIRWLLDGGVRGALASNNIRTPFTPVGVVDLAERWREAT